MIHYILCLAPPSSVWCFQISPCKYIFMLILVEQLRRLTYHLVVTDTEYNLCHENHVYRGCFGTQMITYIASPLTLKYGVAGYQSKVVQNNKHNSKLSGLTSWHAFQKNLSRNSWIDPQQQHHLNYLQRKKLLLKKYNKGYVADTCRTRKKHLQFMLL